MAFKVRYAIHAPSDSDNRKEQHRYSRKTADDGDTQESPPTIRRGLILVFGVLSWLIFGSLGIWLCANRHILIGAAVAGVGCCMLGGTLLLWVLTLFPSTWGWRL